MRSIKLDEGTCKKGALNPPPKGERPPASALKPNARATEANQAAHCKAVLVCWGDLYVFPGIYLQEKDIKWTYDWRSAEDFKTVEAAVMFCARLERDTSVMLVLIAPHEGSAP
jgi:hypothetical protein